MFGVSSNAVFYCSFPNISRNFNVSSMHLDIKQQFIFRSIPIRKPFHLLSF